MVLPPLFKPLPVRLTFLLGSVGLVMVIPPLSTLVLPAVTLFTFKSFFRPTVTSPFAPTWV